MLYLQYGDETKHIRMPNEITSIDTVRALFVSAFPQQLTMKMLESPSVAVYVKDDMRNVYYELSDVRSGLLTCVYTTNSLYFNVFSFILIVIIVYPNYVMNTCGIMQETIEV